MRARRPAAAIPRRRPAAAPRVLSEEERRKKYQEGKSLSVQKFLWAVANPVIGFKWRGPTTSSPLPSHSGSARKSWKALKES